MESGNTWVVLTTAFMLFAVTTQAVDIISVNITKAGEANVSEPYGIAGEGTVASNWNNVTGDTSNLNFADGSASTVGMDVYKPTGNNSVYASDYTNTPLRVGFQENLGSNPHATMTFTDLNANFTNGYKVIVYLTGPSSCNAASISDGTTTNYYKTLWTPSNFDGTLIQTFDTYYDGTSPSVPVAQYAVFGSDAAPLTADSITLTMDALLNAGAAVGGAQIVAAEPASLPLSDDFANYTDDDGKVTPTTLSPWDWPTVMSNPWNGTAAKYFRNGDGCIFGSTNGSSFGNLDAPADSTGGVAAKLGYATHGSNSYEVLTLNTGIKFSSGSSYKFEFRAMVKNKNNNTGGDASAAGQINCIAGYYNAASNDFVSVKNENATNLTASGWTNIDFAISGLRLGTNVLGNDIVVRLSRGNFTNTTDYLTWVDFIRIDEYTPVADWLASHGLTNASWTADADGDKIDNFTEFATGGDPNDPESIGFIGPSFMTEVNGTNRLAYITPRQVDYWVNGVDYNLQQSTDLVLDAWGSAGTWLQGVEKQGFSAEFDAVTNLLGNIDANDKQFLRLKVSHPNYNP